MGKRSSFSPLSVTPRKKQQKVVSRFGGVDYSSQKFLIGDGRAIDLSNYIYKDKVIQKRHGFEEIYKIEPYRYLRNDGSMTVQTNSTNFNGIWKLEAEDNQIHIIAHIGKLLYEVINLGKNTLSFNPITVGNAIAIAGVGNFYRCEEYVDYGAQEFKHKSFAFVGGKKLWFAGGTKWVCIRYTDRREVINVENSYIAPIPITTMSITCDNALTPTRSSYDDVNLLQDLRINRLISGQEKIENAETDLYTYTLDAPLIVRNLSDMSKVRVTIKHRGRVDK